MLDPITILILALLAAALAFWLVRRRHRSATNRFAIRVLPPLSKKVGGWGGGSDRRWLWDSLTPREMQVARLVAHGKRNADIARELHITINELVD